MSKKDGYKDQLKDLIESSIGAGTDDRLRHYLALNSNLPGPRGNLELAYAFAEVSAELSMKHPRELLALALDLTLLPASEAPVNDPREIIPFCGALAVGAIGAVHKELVEGTLERLKEMSCDPRWRSREGVAMGLQYLMANNIACLEMLETWISDDRWLVVRAVVAGVAEPSLLRDERIAMTALEIHKRIVARIMGSSERRSDEFRTLRQALGYSLSVVVSALPREGFEYMRQLAPSNDRDVRWIVKENLGKKRLTGRYPGEVRAVMDIVTGARST
jgi:hypothetical protein